MKVLEKDSTKKSNKELPSKYPSRLLHHQTESTLSGEEVPLLHHSQHSPACGSQRKTTTNTDLRSSIENASERIEVDESINIY